MQGPNVTLVAKEQLMTSTFHSNASMLSDKSTNLVKLRDENSGLQQKLQELVTVNFEQEGMLLSKFY